jgi:hypothetical protein
MACEHLLVLLSADDKWKDPYAVAIAQNASRIGFGLVVYGDEPYAPLNVQTGQQLVHGGTFGQCYGCLPSSLGRQVLPKTRLKLDVYLHDRIPTNWSWTEDSSSLLLGDAHYTRKADGRQASAAFEFV